MRHGKKFNHLGRTASHRKAMLANMAASLIDHKRITTTVAKAKALRKYVEPLITKSKCDTTHSRRIVFSYLQDKNAVTILFGEVAEKIANRPGGYTRIIRTGNRLGDNSEMCIIELVDYNELLLQEEKPAKRSGGRRPRRKKEKSTANNSTLSESGSELDTIEISNTSISIYDPNLSHLNIKERISMIYKIDPSGLDLNETEVQEAIHSFYINRDKKFSYQFALKTGKDSLKIGENQPFEASLELLDIPKDINPELLKHFAIRFFSFDLKIDGNYKRYLNFEKERSLSCVFNAIPLKRGEINVYIDCFRNANNFHQESLSFNVD